MDPMSALNLFKEELNSEEAAVRVNCIRRLPLVAASLGESKQVKETLYGLIDRISKETDEDEILFGLADSLLKLTAFFRTAIIPILERLAVVEETVVRDKACEVFVALVKQADKSELSGVLVPSIIKLAQNEVVISKISALNLISEVYNLVTEVEKKLFFEKINGMFSEDSLMLRRVLASKLGVLCKYMPKDTLLGDVLHHLKTLGCDDSDQVKILTIESLVQLATLFTPEENKNHIIPLIIQMTSDKSWKVKHHLAKEFANLAHAVGHDITDNSLISIFSALLRDPENEVRIIAVKSLRKFANMISAEKISTVVAYLGGLAKDSVALVRVGTCEVLQVFLESNMDPVTNKEMIKFRVQPIIVDLLQDKEIEVKIEAIKLLKSIAKYQGQGVLELMSTGVYPIDLESPNWRIRHTSLQALLDLSNEFKSPKIFEKYFRKFVNQASHDKAFKVRQLSVKSLKKLSEYLEQGQLVNLLKEFCKVASNPREFYIYRITAIYGIETLVALIEDRVAVKEAIARCICTLVDDQVANVRQTVTQVLLKLSKTKQVSDNFDDIAAGLNKMREKETDREIKHLLAKSM